MAIRHLSFDLWMTLIKSNPVFKIKRAEYFYDRYNPRVAELTELNRLIREIDRRCDAYNEKTGKKVPANVMYSMILTESGNDAGLISGELLNDIESDMNRLFSEFSPFLLNGKIKNTLENLRNDGYTLNLASNTGFIGGNVILNILKDLNLYDYFDFFIFSDQICVSKPSAFFYDFIFDRLKDSMSRNEVMHIGDNYHADFSGAVDYGFHAMYICRPDYTYYDIKKEIYEKNPKIRRPQNTV
jgi:putative hydrolase of the HAD superfamily